MKLPLDLKLSLLNYLNHADLISAINILEISRLEVNKYLKLKNRIYFDFIAENVFYNISSFIDCCSKQGIDYYDVYDMFNSTLIVNKEINLIEFIPNVLKFFSHNLNKYSFVVKAIIDLYSISRNFYLPKIIYNELLKNKISYELIIDHSLKINFTFIISYVIKHLAKDNNKILPGFMKYFMNAVSDDEFIYTLNLSYNIV